MKGSSDDALLARLLKGELSAFDELLARHERGLLGFIRQQVRDPVDAEDVLHDTFLALLGDASARSARNLKAWLYQVARNLCLNRARSQQRRDGATLALSRVAPEAVASVEALLERRDVVVALEHAVKQLPAELGELYRLRAGGLSYAELAEVLELPLGTVKSRLHEVMSRLKEELS